MSTPIERSSFPLVLGLNTFGDVTNDAQDRPLSHAQTLRNVVEQGVFAEQVAVPRSSLVPVPDDLEDRLAVLVAQPVDRQIRWVAVGHLDSAGVVNHAIAFRIRKQQ